MLSCMKTDGLGNSADISQFITRFYFNGIICLPNLLVESYQNTGLIEQRNDDSGG